MLTYRHASKRQEPASIDQMYVYYYNMSRICDSLYEKGPYHAQIEFSVQGFKLKKNFFSKFFFFFFQPYIPSRKAVYVVWKKELSMCEKRKTIFKDKKKNLSAPELEPGSLKVPRVGKGSSIT